VLKIFPPDEYCAKGKERLFLMLKEERKIISAFFDLAKKFQN